MHVEPVIFNVEELQERAEERSEGVHQSDLIKRIMRALDPKRFGGDDGPDPATLELGFVWEEVLSRGLGQRIRGWRQMEVLYKGVWRTLDGFSHQDWAVLESKATKISATNPITSARFQHWHMQGAGYARATDTDTVIFKVIFINGDYEKAKFGVPIARGYRLRFTEREMRDNDRMLEGAYEEEMEERRGRAR